MNVPFLGDVDALQQYIHNNRDAVFVSLDTKGTPDISELALSVLPAPTLCQLASGHGDRPPSDMDSLVDAYGVKTYSFRENGKHKIKRGNGYRRPILQFGTAQWVDAADLAPAVTAKLKAILVAHSNTTSSAGTHVDTSSPDRQQPPLVLVVYHIGPEAYHLDNELISVREDMTFAACVDVECLVKSLSRPDEPSVQNTPRLGDALKAAGLYFRESVHVEQIVDGVFEDIKRRKTSYHKQHAAGNDATRQLGLLVHILHAVVSEAANPILLARQPLPTRATVSAGGSDTTKGAQATPEPVLDRLRALVKSMRRPLYVHSYQSGPTEEQLQRGDDKRAERIKKKEERDLVGSDVLETGALDDLWVNGN
ncbi:uncharacterized protein SPSK_09480 [Sporothrix schenckii 1099-18]|uniref:Uncharacterized protein n=2 Tax=Sporothrix schenckii TaxID=29908 RepID=U7PZ59_SPOS1|nr:uncharacterized protein SPSK_09480 [Sporothrix schenckii 1099-18]ERT00242.1 hypothetical protein HMPREF1624_03613 [Sporothrix schenckii ATCC 58251]KJR85298.1 hypothetical protein SPSK_09480 [Sporothrix schenckii 1099-18]